MIPDVVIAGIIGLIFGIFGGMVIWYWIGHPRCEHNWEKIIDDPIKTSLGIEQHTVVHMCKKCGKRKYTRV